MNNGTKKGSPFSSRIELPHQIHRKEDFAMSDFTAVIAQELVRNEDLNEVFHSHLEKAVNRL